MPLFTRCPRRLALTLLLFTTAAAAARPLAGPPSEIARKVMPSVVLVTTEDEHGEALARGSGFVVAEGVIATNLHVVRGASKALVKVVNAETQLEVLGIVAENRDWDLVLLAVKDLTAPPLPLGDSAALEVGDDVYAVGNPHGLEGTFSAGIVSSIRRLEGDALLQITAPISPGSSGGPIVNKDAEVVGVAVASLMEGQNLNFAISSSYMGPMLKERSDPLPLPGPDVESQQPADQNDAKNATHDPKSEIADLLTTQAEAGDADAMFILAWMYENGEGMELDYREAVNWYKKSAELGNAKAMSNLGLAFAKGNGVAEDDREAVKWFRRAADLGVAEAMSNLGLMYDNGEGVAEDDREAVKWFRKAVDLGDARAMFNLGTMYYKGEGVAEDDREAVKWFRKAAELGDATAMFNLGTMYYSGKGVGKDDRAAVKWYRKAAELGEARAMNNLGNMYDWGEGVAEDDIEAYAWLSTAAAFGHKKASEVRDLVAKNLTSEARLTGQARAREHFERIRRQEGNPRRKR